MAESIKAEKIAAAKKKVYDTICGYGPYHTFICASFIVAICRIRTEIPLNWMYQNFKLCSSKE